MLNLSEDQLQKWCVAYLKATHPNLLFFHPANGGKRNPIEAAKFKAMGVTAGVADLVFINDFNFPMVFCELKVGKGKQSPEQIEFQQKVEKRGHKYVLIRTQDEFMGLCKQIKLWQ